MWDAPPTDLGKMRGNDDARRTETAEFDADAAAVLAWLQEEAPVAPGQLGTFGWVHPT